MSHEGSLANGEPAENLAVIDEECLPVESSHGVESPKKAEEIVKYSRNQDTCVNCKCLDKKINVKDSRHPELEYKREEELRAQFKSQLDYEISLLKERADFILQNEQIRVSCMFQEAYRERQEKISALQSQLECKNLAGVMYVMCTERRRSKLEKMRIIEEYTNYINQLKQILTDAQTLILNLSRGFKTAARVDHEWRQKMSSVLKEFQIFVHDYVKGTTDTEQFLFNLPLLLSTQAPIVDNPNEDPCESVDAEEDFTIEEESVNEDKAWYDRLDEPDECRPFIMFGDMADFKPPRRREVLKAVKAQKTRTAPKKWKEYAFNDMFIKHSCSNLEEIKHEQLKRMPTPAPNWECGYLGPNTRQNSQTFPSRRATSFSNENHGGSGMPMGSILKIVTSNVQQRSKPMLLGARDSMEIASTTKLRQKLMKRQSTGQAKPKANVNVINVGSRRTSLFDESSPYAINDEENWPDPKPAGNEPNKAEEESSLSEEEASRVESKHSMSVGHQPEDDHIIHDEKVCPMDKCRRMQMDSFMRSLPAYMRASPYTPFQVSYDSFETCTREQIDILKKRIEKSKKKEKEESYIPEEDPLQEWSQSVIGVSVQTSEALMMLPPCTCLGPAPSPRDSAMVFNYSDLMPMKKALSEINKKYFFDDNIDFDRFKVVGQDDDDSQINQDRYKPLDRLREIKKVLKLHPSLLDIFQANTV